MTARCRIGSDQVILENGRIRLVFPKEVSGYREYAIQIHRGQDWYQVGVGRPFSRLAYRSFPGPVARADHALDIVPTACDGGEENGEARAELSARVTDVDGVEWNFRFRFTLGPDENRLRVTYMAQAGGPRDLLLFRGPTLYAGQGSFGAAKDLGLFPGLEFLTKGESSSSSRDTGDRLRFRHVPHPYKITMPLMAVLHQGDLLALTWDPRQRWDGDHAYPAARFASPNWLEGQDNHLLGLFLPSVLKWVDENDDRTLTWGAQTPYPMKAGASLILEAWLLADHGVDLPGLMRAYFNCWGLPEPPTPPHSLQEALALATEAWLKELWDKEAATWHIALPEPAPASGHFAPETCLQLWKLSSLTDDQARRQVMRQRVQTAVTRAHEQAETGTGDSSVAPLGPLSFKIGIVDWSPGPVLDLAFQIGVLERWLPQVRQALEPHLATQRSDGSWRFGDEPFFSEEALELGQPEETALGLCAGRAYPLLKYARITGDEACLIAGLKALDFMEGLQRPAGAQTWEVPLHGPDLQAVTLAILAYLEGYRITNDPRYREKAARWAYAGLPFLYTWSAHDRAIMRYGTVPVFAASYFRNPWFGIVVQWCGLAYADALLKLAHYDQGFPWRTIAESLVYCALQQQEPTGPYRGTYTDGLSMLSGAYPYTLMLSSNWIVRNVLTLLGQSQEASTVVLPMESRRLHITSAAQITNAYLGQGRAGRKGCTFQLRYPEGETSFTLLAGFPEPRVVQKDGRELEPAPSLGNVAQGWCYRPEEKYLVIKVRHWPAATVHVEAGLTNLVVRRGT